SFRINFFEYARLTDLVFAILRVAPVGLILISTLPVSALFIYFLGERTLTKPGPIKITLYFGILMLVPLYILGLPPISEKWGAIVFLAFPLAFGLLYTNLFSEVQNYMRVPIIYFLVGL